MNIRRKIRKHLPDGIYESVLATLGHSSTLRPDPRVRHDVTRIEVDDRAHIEVFWKDMEIGKGPALSLFIENSEVLRFDCFGKDRGHFHVALFKPRTTEADRLYFAEATRIGQIDRAVHEITRNLPYYQQRNVIRRVREATIDKGLLAQAAEMARSKMLGFLESVPALREHVAD